MKPAMNGAQLRRGPQHSDQVDDAAIEKNQLPGDHARTEETPGEVPRRPNGRPNLYVRRDHEIQKLAREREEQQNS
jgi:hypothetical protein